ncbi:hypothetical protein ACFQUU_15165, partial [Herbaspirillum sp. GCM10030257]|uniref:hypothetical protein n=1 Tax=Herbaspirillum sp. GCM10030257 TaxID=3273393 RepID=UPI00361C4BE7
KKARIHVDRFEACHRSSFIADITYSDSTNVDSFTPFCTASTFRITSGAAACDHFHVKYL